MTEIVDLRTQVPDGVLAIGRDPVRLTWRVSPAVAGRVQLAYEVETSRSPGFEDVIASTGPVESSDQVGIVAPGKPLLSREVRYLRVRISTVEGWTPWGSVVAVEAGLLDPEDWVAQAVTLPDDPGAERQSPVPLVRRDFEIAGEVVKARLYVTSHGVHRVTLNGVPVSNDILAPGWTTYSHRLLGETYDVTSLLSHGANAIAGMLGDGWYRGRLGWDPSGGDRCRYGRDVALVAQLEIELADGTSQVIATDPSWRASTAEILSADLYDGATVDLRQRKDGWQLSGHDETGWRAVRVVPFDPTIVEPRSAPPVRRVAVLPARRIDRPNGSVMLDGGQNIAGWVVLTVRGKAGDRVTVRHAEVLEPDGSLHLRALRTAKAADTYILADDAPTELEPSFTFHGFRFAEVVTQAELLDAEFVVISSAMPRRGEFTSSDASLDRFHANVVWSQRDNFVSVPTDCPQRDERLGWTGDAQAFAATASTLFDSQAFWQSWLRDLDLDQHDDLGVPSVVPDVVLHDDGRYGRAGWGDAATIVPWAVYESYGDVSVLRRAYGSMRRWVDSLRRRGGVDGLLGTTFQFGDWLDPDAPGDRPSEAKTSSDYLANAFYAHSARLTADAGTLLGDEAVAAAHLALSDTVRDRTWARWADHAVTTQTGCAVALQFGICPAPERPAVAAALARLVREAEGRVSTGFLGTPLVLPALAGGGYFDEAYLMLLRHAPPSWLYQVDRGATTVWERWDAILPDGSIHPGTMTKPPIVEGGEPSAGHMLSFNHYAYGAVIDWVYRNVGGVAPDLARPGYRQVLFAPRPHAAIDRAAASADTPYGKVSISWRLREDGTFAAEVDLPFGTSGAFTAPITAGSNVLVDGVDGVDDGTGDGVIHLAAGHHVLTVSEPRVYGRRPASAAAAGPRVATEA